MKDLKESIEQQKQEALFKALDSLSRYKFIMFGYWAAHWVALNNLAGWKDSNPFLPLVKGARRLKSVNNYPGQKISFSRG